MLRYRFLFEQMVRRELRQKYKGSTLGVLWYLVNPLILMGAYALVFNVLLKVATVPDYPLFLISGLIVWVFFSQALLAAAPSLVVNAPLIRKVRFPRQTIPASVATVQLVTFLVMLVLLVPVALIVRGNLDPSLLLLPVVAAGLFCLVLGFSFGASILHVHYRDVEPVLAALLLPWFFVTPIFLRVDDFPGARSHQWLADLLQWGNPVAPFVDSLRQIVYAGTAPSMGSLLYVVGVGAGAVVLGWLAFQRMERDLAVIV
ncbi:MAG: lipopolysaccharide transport system permease protein [Thermoleophilaceae bacterium]|nr:lipopolysaccharide transport system permease protein [Thermoleophilaceae bacterium]